MAPARVPLLEPEELYFGLDALENADSHCGWRVWYVTCLER